MNFTGSTFKTNFDNSNGFGKTGNYTAMPPMTSLSNAMPPMTSLSYGAENKHLPNYTGPQQVYPPYGYSPNPVYAPSPCGTYTDFRPKPQVITHDPIYDKMRATDNSNTSRMADMHYHLNHNQQTSYDKDATIRNQARVMEELNHRIMELEEKLVFTNSLEKELLDLRLRHEKEMTENSNIIERLKISLNDAARYRPSLDQKPYYDARTVDILTGGPPKTEIIYKTDPYLQEQLDMYKRHNIQVLEENA